MNVQRFASFCLALIAGLTLSFGATLAPAQGPAGRKVTGEAYWPAKASRRHVETARYYAQEFQSYVKAAPQPEPSVVKDIKTELSRYLDEGQNHLATMKKDLEGD